MSTSPPATDAPTDELERTALYDEHVALGATIVDFHGWEMPIRYGKIPEEHLRVRESAGLFDLGHMGRLRLSGPGALAWLQRILTNDISALEVGDARYSLICREDGGVIDDAVVYRLPDEWLLVVNASNRARVLDWLDTHRNDDDAGLVDASSEWSMIAVQGPESVAIASPLFENPSQAWDDLRYYRILQATIDGTPVQVARTGYTGEDGLEVYLPNAEAVTLWRRLLEVGGEKIAPIGLGARDTLRLEAGVPLYGQEIDETTSPFDAGLGFAVKLGKTPAFVGQERVVKNLKTWIKDISLPAKKCKSIEDKVSAGRKAANTDLGRRGGETSGLMCPLRASDIHRFVPAGVHRDRLRAEGLWITVHVVIFCCG